MVNVFPDETSKAAVLSCEKHNRNPDVAAIELQITPNKTDVIAEPDAVITQSQPSNFWTEVAVAVQVVADRVLPPDA